MKKRVILILTIIVVGIILGFTIDTIRNLYLVEHFFVVHTIVALIIVAYLVNDKKIKKQKKFNISSTSNTNKIHYLPLVICVLIIWCELCGMLLLRLFIEPDIISSKEKSIDKFTDIYTEDEKLDIVLYYIELEDSLISWFDVNKINSRYPIEVLKINSGGYHAYFRTENEIVKISFDYLGNVIGIYALNLTESVDAFSEISVGDSEDTVKKLFGDEGFVEPILGFYSSTHYTRDGYCVEIVYRDGRIVNIRRNIF